ncbi:MAG: hypothetical protein C4519_19805 [Desulfobacteraceae bacterium]|nr:MAG: hypothetical protein C4519_19805 [Desulfobacteraceae bacterium]
MSSSDYDRILSWLMEQYPGRMFLGVKELAEIYGCSEKTIYCRTHRKASKRFPVQPARVPGKKFKLTDIARALSASES